MNNEEFELLRANFLGSENYLISYLKNHSGNTDKIKEILQTLRSTPISQLKSLAEEKFNSIENGEVDGENLERVECELTLLLMCIPPDLKVSKDYWDKKISDIKQNNVEPNGKILIEIAAQHPLIDGKPGEEFAARLDRGIELYHEELSKGNEVLIYIPGSTHSIYDKTAEAWQTDANSLSTAGKNYLLSHGIPENIINSDEANEKYEKRGVYNSGDECFVATSIAMAENCGRIMSVVSPVQIYRKALFYIENGYIPEMYSVPLSNTFHNYVGELFWSLYVTLMEDHTWQEGFLAEKTREERNVNYESEVSKETESAQRRIYDILNNGLNLPEPVYAKKAEWLDKYSKAKDNMKANSSEPNILIEADFSEENFDKELDILCQSLSRAQGKNCVISLNDFGVSKTSDIQARLETLDLNSSFEFLPKSSGNIYDTYSSEHCSDLYIVCSSDTTISKAIDGIKNGVVPQVFAVPSEHDDFISEIFQMYERVLEVQKTKSPEEKPDLNSVFTNTDWKQILENDIER